ncbi:MAG: DUF1549 domain-containing protein [Planctomycetes bacterium]|nr:DUF1549 domain-containing protein [Planctomycetota bacterium]
MRRGVCLRGAVVGLLLLWLQVGFVRADEPLPASERFAKLDSPAPVSFRRDVIPMFARIGCSGRACHGSFQGKGGFRFSLFGYDFKADHEALTAGEKPRVNLADPDESLVIQKPTLMVKHEGKQKIREDSWEYNVLYRWIKDGAKNDADEVGQLDRLEVQPAEILFDSSTEPVQLRVLAHWSDGSVADVTELTRFRTNDESVADVSETGQVTTVGPGDTHIVAFYDNGVTPIPIIRPVSDQFGPKFPKTPAPTQVDRLVLDKLAKLGEIPAPVCTDEQFIRRVSLDLTGTLPPPQRIVDFINDKDTHKRAKLIDELLDTPAYAAYWTTRLCDITGNNPKFMGEKTYRSQISEQWYDWLYKRVAANEPYDKIVEGIVLATSRDPDEDYAQFATNMSATLRKDHPADFADRAYLPHYWTRDNMKKPDEKALSFAYAFLGVRLQCAQCHKHPFDQWSKQDFEQFQAFFENLKYGLDKGDKEIYDDLRDKAVAAADNAKNDKKDQKKEAEKMLTEAVRDGKVIGWKELYIDQPRQLDAKHLAKLKDADKKKYAGRVITPKLLGGEEVVADQYPDPRVALMQWLREPENPYFAAAIVNRIWANHFGAGIVEPADDLNLANPPSNKPLMDYLTKQFVAHGYDLKWLQREILNSDTYQRSWQTNPTNRLDDRNFARASIRRLPAEVVADAIKQACASDQDAASCYSDLDDRAIGPKLNTGYNGGKTGDSYLVSLFGKPARETNCDCERSADPTLLQTIYMRNDQDMLRVIDMKRGFLGSLDPEAEKRALAQRRYEQELKQHERKMARLKELGRLDEAPAAPAPPPRRELNLDPIITQIFLRTVSREPTAQETSDARQSIEAAASPIDGLRDLLWAMLNTKEFITNH